MSGPARTVAIVVVTYNSSGQIDECLDSLEAGCAGVRLKQVVVVDNASKDDTLARVGARENLPLEVVQLGYNGGYAAGINAGVAALPDEGIDAILVLNPDVRMRPGSVAPLAAALVMPGIGLAVPRLVDSDGDLQPSLRRTPSVLRALTESFLGGPRASRLGVLSEKIMDKQAYDRPRATAWATGGAMLISRAVFREVGSWDESLLLYGEETDFALRAGERGYKVWYEPAAEMVHLGGNAYRTSPLLYALLSVNRVRVFGRSHGRVHTLAFHVAVTLGLVLRAAAGRATARTAAAALLRPGWRLTALPG